ncbi:hypothetical protein PG988_003645 [Apiospora saccharicola]
MLLVPADTILKTLPLTRHVDEALMPMVSPGSHYFEDYSFIRIASLYTSPHLSSMIYDYTVICGTSISLLRRPAVGRERRRAMAAAAGLRLVAGQSEKHPDVSAGGPRRRWGAPSDRGDGDDDDKALIKRMRITSSTR